MSKPRFLYFPAGCSQPVPDSSHLHGGADQAVPGQEDRRASSSHLRHRRQLLHPHDEATPEPVHRHLGRVRSRKDGEHEADPPILGGNFRETFVDRTTNSGS